MADKERVTGLVDIRDGDSRRLFLLNACALGLVLLSAFAVISSTHTCRDYYARLQVLEASQWHYQEEFGRLLLEQSTWASHYRVEQVARRELGMQSPSAVSRRIVLR